MLKELLIQNFAIVDELELSLADGFNVFTGETGAGKSIILDAISCVLGGKTDASFVREGAKRALVEGVFSLGAHAADILAILQREDLLPEDGRDEIILTREIRSEGRSTCRVNGHSVNSALQREIGEFLVDIHGQSDHLSLLKPANHIQLLDHFAVVQEVLNQYQTAYHQLLAVRKQLKEMQINEEEALRQRDMLSFQINEISAARLSEEEESEIQKERIRLANSESLEKNIRRCLESIEGNQSDTPGILDLMSVVERTSENLAKTDADLQPVNDLVINSFSQINDAYDILLRYLDRLEFDPQRQSEIEERLSLYHTLKRKYGGSVSAVLTFECEAQRRLSMLDNSEERTEELLEEEARLLKALSTDAIQLSRKRKIAAEEISRNIENELKDLRMPNAGFRVDISHKTDENGLNIPDEGRAAFNENGFDVVEFFIAPNPGEGFKPLAKIASGGETSRLMLAIKNTLAQADTIPTMIFDEIDQGIGGRVGSVVGDKLWQLARQHQVICITHLPQLAACYDEHFHVRKVIEDNRTHTVVQKLAEDASLHEMAALLGSDSSENLSAAKAMREEALQRRTFTPLKGTIHD